MEGVGREGGGGEHSSCFQAEKDMGGAYSLHLALQMPGCRWGQLT